MTSLLLTAAQAAVVASALAEAEHYRRDIARTWCTTCAAAPDGACPAHLSFVSYAETYRRLRDDLTQAMPHPAKNGWPRCSEHRSRYESATP